MKITEAAETAKAAFDKLKAAVLRARQRAGNKKDTAILPYSQWANLPRRKAAPMADTRQCSRRAAFCEAFVELSKRYASEPRRARRKLARAESKVWWKAR